MQSHRATRVSCIAAAALVAIALTMPSASAYVNVIGGPTSTFENIGWDATGVNNAGAAIGFAVQNDDTGGFLGLRSSYRWDASGAATELGNLGTDASGFTNSLPSAINNAGTVVGTTGKFSSTGEDLGSRAVRWDASGAATELENPGLGTSITGMRYSEAYAINDAGTIVGSASKFDDAGGDLGSRAVRWDASGAPTELGNLGTTTSGVANIYATTINDAGTIVGSVSLSNVLGNRAVRWDAGGTAATELGNLGTDSFGATYTGAYAINNAGTIVGQAFKYDVTGTALGASAVRWDAGGTAATELGNPGLGTDTGGGATAINDAGMIVGTYGSAGVSLGYRAIRWDASGTIATVLGNLGTSAGFTETNAYTINDAGIAIGQVQKYDGAGTKLGLRAVYWGLDGLAVDLNTLIDPLSGWMLEQATVISDTGWIAGSGAFDPDGPGGQEAYERLFLMQVPQLQVLPGDFDFDGDVDGHDFLKWQRGQSPTPLSQLDLTNWRSNFGDVAPGVEPVPEPSAALLLLSALLWFPPTLGRRNTCRCEDL